jgi:DNA-directed RNA polymerase specialized sigma24 family protein
MLDELAKINDQLYKMALSICNDAEQANDILQDTYLKLYDTGKRFEDINLAYIYFTMKSIFLDSKRKSYFENRVEPTDFQDWNLIQEEQDAPQELNKPLLTNFEKLLIQTLFGREIVDSEGFIIKKTNSISMLKLSEETGIPYRTIYTNFQNIKRKWKREA